MQTTISYYVFAPSAPLAVKEAYERAEQEQQRVRHDRVGPILLGEWDIFGLKPYRINLALMEEQR